MEKDYERAALLFTRACSGASAPACANLGFAYEKGMGVEKNKNAAKELYDRGCKLGEFNACRYLKNLR